MIRKQFVCLTAAMTTEPTYKDTLTVESENGLHLIPCSQIAKLASGFSGTITLKNGEKTADATSVLDIVALCGTQGTVLEVEAVGAGSEEIVGELRDLFAAGFPTDAATDE